jgi:ubiquinone/menaquinone biosynthesis C-methylase UbiE
VDNRRHGLPPDQRSLVTTPPGRADAIQALATVAVLATIRQSVGPEPPDLIVDLGVGIASLTLSLASVADSVLAVTPDPVALEAVTAHAVLKSVRVRAQLAAPGALRLPASSVDIVVATDALRRVPEVDRRALVVRARRWLRSGGPIVVVGTMSSGSEAQATPDFWQQAISEAGFRDVGYRPVAADVGLAWGYTPGDGQDRAHEG